MAPSCLEGIDTVGATDMRSLEAQARARPRADAGNAVLASSAGAFPATLQRCAIHGIEMDCMKGNTYFCALCLGLSDMKQPGSGNGQGHKKDTH